MASLLSEHNDAPASTEAVDTVATHKSSEPKILRGGYARKSRKKFGVAVKSFANASKQWDEESSPAPQEPLSQATNMLVTFKVAPGVLTSITTLASSDESDEENHQVREEFKPLTREEFLGGVTRNLVSKAADAGAWDLNRHHKGVRRGKNGKGRAGKSKRIQCLLSQADPESIRARAERHIACMQKLRMFTLLPAAAPVVPTAANVHTNADKAHLKSAESAGVTVAATNEEVLGDSKLVSNTKVDNEVFSGRMSSSRRSSIVFKGFAVGRDSVISAGRRSSVAFVDTSTRPSIAGSVPLATCLEDAAVVDSAVNNDLAAAFYSAVSITEQSGHEVSEKDAGETPSLFISPPSSAVDQQQLMGIVRLALEFLSAPDLLITTWSVSRSWQQVSNMVASWIAASTVAPTSTNTSTLPSPNLLRNWQGLQNAFPWGAFLADGAFKSVYKVWNIVLKRSEAISVMDAVQLSDTGQEEVLRQEVQVSTLLSELVTGGKCPNFIETYQVFQFAYKAPSKVWGQSLSSCPSIATNDHIRQRLDAAKERNERGRRTPRRRMKPSGKEGMYTYIRMELCDGGDLESFLRSDDTLPEDGLLPIDELPAIVFQMIMSLAVGQEELNLRHYDVKLLNFFLKRVDNMPIASEAPSDRVPVASYIFNDQEYAVAAPAARAFVVKLADYGTADTSPDTLCDPITTSQFTTLENAPPDFYILGDQSVQGFQADSFSLGLSLLHLLTGSMPYEEIVDAVVCPEELVDAWRAAWASEADGKFNALARILRYDEGINTVPTTLYRFFVMFGLPIASHDRFDYKSNVVLNTFFHKLNLKTVSKEPVKTEPVKRRSARKPRNTVGMVMEGMRGSGALYECFVKHREEFGVFHGTNRYMKIAQERMANVPGAEALLKGLLEYDPDDRMDMTTAMQNEMFECLKVTAESV